jgi:3-deoxy-D-manno-octulosonate 8-phosphate phosphatase (KDO 8-P phosphatase)
VARLAGDEARARQVGMRYVYQGCIEKIPILDEIRAASGISLGEVAYMGDDVADAIGMRRAGLAIAPATRSEVKRAPTTSRPRPVGGAVREICELLFKAHAPWEELLRNYEVTPIS